MPSSRWLPRPRGMQTASGNAQLRENRIKLLFPQLVRGIGSSVLIREQKTRFATTFGKKPKKSYFNLEAETIRRYTDYAHNCHTLLSLHRQLDKCESEMKKREAYVSQSQLLAYLHSKRGRVQPRKLAKALADPMMKWRQSRVRCFKFSFSAPVHLNFALVTVLKKESHKLDGRIANRSLSAIQSALSRIGSRRHVAIRFVCEHWRDLRLVMEQLSNGEKGSVEA